MGLPRLRFPFFNQGCCRRRCCCLLSLLLSFLNQPKYAWVPHLRRGFMRLRWECTNSPRQLLPLPLPLLLPLPLPLLLPLPLPLPLLLFLPLPVLRRHSERSEESPHFRGERSDPSAFL